MQINNIKNFYSLAHTKIKLIEEVRKYFGRETSPQFNSFNFWWFDENKISQILAFFLNPNENHDQGDVYLKHFIKKFGLDKSIAQTKTQDGKEIQEYKSEKIVSNKFQYDDIKEVKVKCELRTDNDRFIDIAIYKNYFEWAIAIENKINLSTKDQDKQLDDYNTYLSENTKEYCLIYLAPKDKAICESSMSSERREALKKKNKFKHLTYEDDLIDCVAEFAMMTESIRVKSFLKDFEKTLRSRYMGEKDMEAKEAIIDLMKESVENIEISQLIYNSWEEMKSALKVEFKNQLKELVNDPELNLREIHSDDLDKSRTWLQPKSWNNYYFGYEFDKNDIFFGMAANIYNNKAEIEFESVRNFVNIELKDTFHSAGWWPIYKYINRNLNSSPNFWVAIKSGTAKQEIRRLIKLMVDKYETDDF